MWILKKINNNCALARDASGQDVVVFGKGIGYKRPPYELTDLSVIDRTFYGVQNQAVLTLADLPEDIVLLSADIIEYARDELDVELNPNAPITLADHIAFAIQRVEEGLAIQTPLAFDVRHLYPKETAIGKRAVTLVKSRLGVQLPEAEVTNIALHIIDAEAERSDMNATLVTAEVVGDVRAIVERHLGFELDVESFSYARFVMHLRFLIGRMLGGEQGANGDASMLAVMRDAYPAAFDAMSEIVAYFEGRGWTCEESERLYLLIHVQRLQNSRR